MKINFNVHGKKVPLQSLRYISKENQLEVMRNWFYDNFEDPAESCPYDGREGGYAYIYGGPYDANDELQSMFGENVKLNYIEELADELQEHCWEWSGNSNNVDWYDEDLYDAVTSSHNPFVKFVENIEKIKSLAIIEYQSNHKEHLFSILYTNVITALETLYVELFTNSLEKESSYIANCIEKGRTEFKVSKNIIAMPFKGEPIEKIREELLKEIKEHLISASWHSTKKVVERYKSTFDITVQKDWPIDEIEMATVKRNHLVHRSGKDKDGNQVVITEQNLEELIEHAQSLGEKLCESLNKAMQKKDIFSESEF